MPDSNREPIPVFRLDPEEVPRRLRFEAWREIIRPIVDVTPLGPERRFELRYEAYTLDGLVLSESSAGAHGLERGPRHLRPGDTDHITLRAYTRGRAVMGIGDQPLALAPGTIALLDRRYPTRGHAVESTHISCVIPRERIDTRPFDRAPALARPLDSPEGRLLSNALLTLWAELPRARAEEAKGLAAGLTGLVNGLLSARPDEIERRAFDETTLAAMEAFIKRHLHHLDLDATTLCRTFACSRARLYRLFRPYGGVERYLRDQRLERCFLELTRGVPTRRRIGSVAARWGFEDPSHFHRLFKSRLGIAPSEVPPLVPDPDARPDAPALLGQQAEIAQLHRWFRQQL